MKIKSAIIVVTTFLGVFASIALLGGVLQKAQDAGVSASDAGFVPSIGQINLGTHPRFRATVWRVKYRRVPTRERHPRWK